MTLPKHNNDLFIFFDSSNCCPVVPVILILSLPAKSTKFNFPTFICVLFPSFSSVVICSTVITKTAWERDETSFIYVALVALKFPPLFNNAYKSSGVRTAHSDNKSTYIPFFLSSLICKFFLSGFNKSDIFSLYICKKLALIINFVFSFDVVSI